MPRAVEVIINARSGTSNKEALRDQLAELFQQNGIEARISLARSGESVVELARRAAHSDAGTVVAGGGDGTINAVASTLIDTDKTLGVLPLGTLNHFAKDLTIPLDLEGAAQTIIANHAVQLDVGEVNGQIFLNNSSLGLYPSLVHQREQRQRLGHGKWPAFIWAALSVMRRYPFLDVRLNADGKEFSCRTPFVFVGNNKYEMESFNIGTRARLDGGQLSLYFSHRTQRLGLVRLAFRALLGRAEKTEEFVAMSTTEVSIETRRSRIRVATDGEVTMMRPPLRYRVRPVALRVIVPERASVGA
ncbi:MAG TPA: diacylglycerol kinase family protein [Blastocatellia bacterium]|nr:diacylglycerol kinase family protein [Blastocatellia bacterium]